MKGNACKIQMLLYPLETSGWRDAVLAVFLQGVAGLGSDTVDIDIGIL